MSPRDFLCHMRSRKGSNKELRNEILRLRSAMLEIVSIFEGAIKQWLISEKEIATVWTVLARTYVEEGLRDRVRVCCAIRLAPGLPGRPGGA